jgi:hypothetical protein
MKGGPRVVTDKMLALEQLVGPPVKDEVDPWTRGVEPTALQVGLPRCTSEGTHSLFD